MALTLFDTSALVASLIPAHPHHAWATLQRKAADGLAISAHTLAETYKVLSVHPQIRMPPQQVQEALAAVMEQVRVVELDAADYSAVIARCVQYGFVGSVIFDALIAQAALKAGAAQLVTLNAKDFRRLGEDVAGLLVTP